MILKKITTANIDDMSRSVVPLIRNVRWRGTPDPDSAAAAIRNVKGRRRPGYGSVPVIMGTVERHVCAWVPEWCGALAGADARDHGHLRAAFDGRHMCGIMASDAAYADGSGAATEKSRPGPARISDRRCMGCALNRKYNTSVKNLLSRYDRLYNMYIIADRDPIVEHARCMSWPEYVEDLESSASARASRATPWHGGKY